MFSKTIIIIILTFILSVNLCAEPHNTDDCCALFQKNFSWYRATKHAEKKWGIPIAVQLAIIKQESDFQAKIKPKRQTLLGFIPWRRPSSAYGYGQVLDHTWRQYLKDNKRWSLLTSRHDIADVTDFIGWYCYQVSKKTRIAKTDAANLYLAYHEGSSGYIKKSFRKKPWLQTIAKKVAANAKRYHEQLQRCESSLRRKHLYFF